MTWKGSVFLVALLALLGSAMAYSDAGLKLALLTKLGLSSTNGEDGWHRHAEGTADEHAKTSSAAPAEKPAAHGAVAEEFERGPHNGRLLRDGSFALEVTIFETGVPPEFHFYAYKDGQPLSPSEVTAKVELARLGGDVDRLEFVVQGEYLKSTAAVIEPHSFDVTVQATHAGASHSWTYSSPEGRTNITEEAASAAGMAAEIAGPVKIEETIALTGSVVLNQDKTAQIKARFPGIIAKVFKSVGDTVKEGEALAIVDANTSLPDYPVVAPFAGVILERNTNLGDVVGAAPLFVITDLSAVWADFHVFSKDLMRVKAGQKIRVKNVQGDGETESAIKIFTPLAELSSQSVIARVTLDNADGRWRPGMTVRGEVVVAKHDVPLAVKTSALQRFRDFTVVFAKFGTTYEVRMLDLGTSDGTWTEVKGGLKPGSRYVTENSFLVKADVEKSGASHDH